MLPESKWVKSWGVKSQRRECHAPEAPGEEDAQGGLEKPRWGVEIEAIAAGEEEAAEEIGSDAE